jgi:hypothetical protein
MPTIDLSDDLYRRLQKHAVPFEDEPADVMARALDALERGPSPERERPLLAEDGKMEVWKHQLLELTSSDLVSFAGRVPHGTQLRAFYKGSEYRAEVSAGSVSWNGRRYPSLSQAAIAVIQSTGSRRATENGWRFWEFYDEDSNEWRSLSELRAA